MFASEERMATATDVRRSAARGPRSSECPGECADQRPELAGYLQLALNAVDYHLLNISRKLVDANELKVALVQLRSILARQSDTSRP